MDLAIQEVFSSEVSFDSGVNRPWQAARPIGSQIRGLYQKLLAENGLSPKGLGNFGEFVLDNQSEVRGEKWINSEVIDWIDYVSIQLTLRNAWIMAKCTDLYVF